MVDVSPTVPQVTSRALRVKPLRRRGARAVYVFLAWLPFLLAWALLNFAYFDISLGPALLWATVTMGSASLLGLGVWWLSGRLEWPDRLRPSFYALHLGVGLVYSVVWILLGTGAHALWTARPLAAAIRAAPDLGWRVLTGLWLYGLVAGVSYAVRIRRGLQREREVALAAEASAAQARLAALRSQLNPHFLFNALHTVSALVEMDPPEAQVALERLGRLLRYSLEHDDAEVPLETEWAFTRDYLEIEALRLEERLRWEASLATDMPAARVPPFALQTLVENAVRHGVARRPEGGRVRITAGIEGDTLVLRVADDGPGARPDAVEASRGRGLRLLRERLAALYRGTARLAVGAAPEGGFVAELRLPARPPVEPDLPATRQEEPVAP
jgi:signal transduction histidine kinase